MLILPAIDLRGGQCVRLLHGRFDAETRYGDPFAQVRTFGEAGASWVHIVDLDGAKAGQPAQYDLIGRLAAETRLKVQSGGGVRTREHVEALLSRGVARVVVGSVAVRSPENVRAWIEEFGAECICVALDVRAAEGGWEVATAGWVEASGKTLSHALADYPEGAMKHALVTDISRDGALTGPNVELMQWLRVERPDVAVQASGGVSNLDDLATLKRTGVAGAIVGRALYEKRFTLEDALAL